MPNPSSRIGLASRVRTRFASRAGDPGGTSRPVLPCTTVSRWLPIAGATTGTPQAIASRAIEVNGSSVATSSGRSAERSRAGRSASRTRPPKISRPA